MSFDWSAASILKHLPEYLLRQHPYWKNRTMHAEFYPKKWEFLRGRASLNVIIKNFILDVWLFAIRWVAIQVSGA